MFISIGDSDKINIFLEKNPKIPRELMFVDGYAMDAYKTVGFKKIDLFSGMKLIKEKRKMTMPTFSPGRWKDYLKSTNDLIPLPKGQKGAFPEGVTMNGGTFAVDGDKIMFAYSDAVPGNYPDPNDVVKSLI